MVYIFKIKNMEAVKAKQIRDTTYIKSDSVFIEKKITEKVTPSWCYIAIIIFFVNNFVILWQLVTRESYPNH